MLHTLLIGLLTLVNIVSSVVAYRLAPRSGADRRDWSFMALFFGPPAIVALVVFGGRSERGRRKAAEEFVIRRETPPSQW